jgi:S-DNA-T family DNA segregation ATPase FtsK/SpoIIIE
VTRFAITVRAQRTDRELLITADSPMDVRQLCAAAGLPGRCFVNGREVSPDAWLADAGAGDGATLSDEPARPRVPVAAPGSLALLVTSGPAAGASVSLPPSGGVVGRDAPLRLGDEEVSASHFRVGVAADGVVTLADAGSTNGTVIAGHAVYDERRLTPGELIWAGRSALTVAQAPTADAALSPGGGGYVRFTRSPRLAKRPSAGRVTIPEPPSEPDSARFPVLAIAAPVLLGLLMAVLLKQLAYLAFIALSPVMLIGNAISDRRHGRRGHQQRLADYERHRDEAMAAMARSRWEELAYQRQVHPDPATLLLIASAPSRRLWERHPGDEDFLALRVGTGTVPTPPAEPEWPPRDPGTAGDQLSDAPAVLHLAECGAVGIAGPRDRAAALARGMLLSLAVLHSPREVTVTVLTGPQAARDWDWVRWLPHAREPDSADCVVRMGNDPESVKLRVDELTAALAARLPDPSHGRPPPVPACCDVVILDGAHQFRIDARIAALLQHGPAAGMYFLCLDEDVARLPPECRRAVVELSDDDRATLAHLRGPRYAATDITADVVSPRVCEAGARAMAPLRESGEATADSLPASLRFLDLAGLEPPSAPQIRARWAAGGRTTRALLGSKADGPFVLDLAHGPHLLVAGTTGSGKSELLQTLVASLAVGNRPDAMNFVLVDYKGGAAFQACAPLPHTVGVVTDLDEFEVDRALTSLRAELQRRKAVLSKAGKSNVELYWEVLSADLAADPLPRLVIVVDEFAVMAEQQPDQLRSLVDIGMQGRSLGIHLILATQRPAGVVTADLRANINLRIALRVASPDDSRDVIETVAAASIPATGCAGRAYAWLGGGRPVPFQAARVGGLRPGARPDRGAADVIPFGWAELGRPLGRPAEPQPDPSEPTDLSTLVTAIGVAAEGQIPPQASPWRPPLPSELSAGQVPVLAASDADLARPGPLQVVFGLADEPRRQRQVPAVFDLERGGHLLVAGAPQSGRTTLLRTLAGRLAGQASPDDAHLYVFDGGGGLAALSALPHCGAVVTPAEPDRLDRLLARLSGELSRRSRLLSASGCGDLAEYRQQHADGKPPFLLVLIDRYDAVVTAVEHVDNGRLLGEFQRLVRDGLAAGIRVAFTGDRSLLTGRLAALAEDKIVLRMADRTDYALASLNSKTVPAAMPSGRGFRLPAGDLLQVALLSGQPLGSAENQALRATAARCPRPAAGPFRVDPLPAMITYEQACELPLRTGSGVLVGVGGDDLAQIRVDAPGLLIVGQRRSSRTTALAVQARSLSAMGTPLVLVTPRPSALPAAVGTATVALHLTETGAEAVSLLTEALNGPGPIGLVVDDADLLVGTPLGDELLAVSRQIRDGSRSVLAATISDNTMLRGLALELANNKCGLVLEPANALDGQPFGARLPSSVLGSGVTLRAALVHDGMITNVQVPEIINSLAGSAAVAPD